MAFPNAAKSGFTLEDLSRMGPDEITRKRRLAEALLAESQGIRNIRHPLEGMAQMAQALIGNLKEARLDRAEREGKDFANTQWNAAFNPGEFPAAPGAKPSGSDYSQMADGPKGMESYLSSIRSAESGGNDSAKNPTSSATGRYQFIGSTWEGLRKNHPELGLTPEGRTDPAQQERAIRQFTADNAKVLSGAGIPLTGGNLYAAHFLGSGGAAKVLSSDLSASIASIVGSDVVNANPFLRGMTVADFSRWAAKKGGSGPIDFGSKSPAEMVASDVQPRPQIAMPFKGPAEFDPAQVASLDPAVGMPALNPVNPAPNQAAIGKALIEQGIDPNGPQAQAFGSIGAGNPGAVNTPPPIDPAAQVPLPTPAAPNVAPPGAPAAQAPLPQQQQMAQALIGQPQDPAMTLGAPAIQPGGPDMGTLMNMAGNEFMSPQQQRMIEALTGRRLEREDRAADPAYQMDLERKRLELDKLRRGDPSEALDLELKRAQLQKLQTGDPKDALEVEKLRLEVEDAKKGGKADYKVVNDRLIKTQGDKVEDVTPNAPNGAPVPAKFDDVSGVRKEIVQLPSYKNLSQAVPIYKSMVETAGRDNKASDLNLVYGLGKIMDPTSVVREGELHMANDTQGMADYLNGIIKGIQGEGRLSPEARAQIMTEAYGRVKAYQDVFAVDSEMYRGIAKRSNMNEADVIPNLGEGLSPWTPATPPASAVPVTPAAPPSAIPGAPRKTKTGVPWSISP